MPHPDFFGVESVEEPESDLPESVVEVLEDEAVEDVVPAVDEELDEVLEPPEELEP